MRQDTRAPSAQRPAPSAVDPAPSAQHPAPSAQRPVPGALRSPASTRRPAPSAQRPAPSAQRPAPSAQRPAPTAQRPTLTAQRAAPGLLRKRHKSPKCCEKPTKSRGIFTRGVHAPDSGPKPPGGRQGQKGHFGKTYPVPIFRAGLRKPIRFYPAGASAGTRSGSAAGTRLASRSSRDMRCTVRSAKPVSAAIWWLLCPR